MTRVLVAGGIFREVIAADGHGSLGREVRLAGSGLYAGVAAARLGADVTLVAPVGADDADLARALCEEAGVRPLLLLSRGASGTFALERSSGARPRPQYRPAEGVLDEGSPERVNADVVLAFGHPEWDPCSSRWVTESAVDAILLWDRQGWLSRTPGAHSAAQVPSRRRMHLANAGELLDDSVEGPTVAMAGLPADGYEATIVKDGRWGVHVIHRGGGHQSIAAFDVHVRQTVGSGDVFAGAMCAALADGAELVEGCETAAAAAAAWIASDASLPGKEFAETVRALRTAARLPVASPELVRGSAAAVAYGNAIGSAALAEAMRRMLEDLGVPTVDRGPAAPDGVEIQLRGRRFVVSAHDSNDLAGVETRLEQFVASVLRQA